MDDSSGTAPGRATAGLPGAVAMVFVGGSVAVSGLLTGAPLFGTQAVRYAIACLLLLALARAARRRLVVPRGPEWLWLLAVSGTGLVVFNVALVRGASHAEPAVLGVAVACVPVALAVVGPLLEGRRPRPLVLAAAAVVTCGAVLVQGLGRTDATGLVWAAVVLVCEAAFTLLAVPVLGRHGPWGVSVHATWIGALLFAVLAAATEGPAALLALQPRHVAALAYLAVAVTALAFVLWYSTVRHLGAARAGLLTGIAPVAAAGTGVALGGDAPAASVWVGIGVVAAGLVLGLVPRSTPGSARRWRPVPPPRRHPTHPL